MKIVENKKISYEEEVVEYCTLEEFLEDLDERRKLGWKEDKRPNFELGCMEMATLFSKNMIIQKYKRVI